MKYFGFIVDIIVARHYQPKLIAHFFFHIMRKYFQIGFVTQGEDFLRVDVVIPTIAKDTDLLLTMVNSLKTYIRHTINNIYIVSKNTPEIINLCRENNFIFIDEFELIGYGKEKITYTYKGINRSGWIFQQLLKLSGDKITECDDYIIVDSDTLLINDHHFKNRDKYIFYENEEWHEPYFKSYSKIFGYRPSNRMSFTSHMMIFNRQYLRAMKSEMELLHKKTWDRVYLSTINENEMSCISDYDTYANWVFHNYPENVLRLPLYNRSMPRVHLHNLELLHKEFGKTYKSLSFHSYYGKDIRDIIKESNL